MHILNIVTSPRKEQSASRALVDAFLKRYGPSLDHGRDSQAIPIEGGVGSSASCSR
jgi:hypothetical protein